MLLLHVRGCNVAGASSHRSIQIVELAAIKLVTSVITLYVTNDQTMNRWNNAALRMAMHKVMS